MQGQQEQGKARKDGQSMQQDCEQSKASPRRVPKVSDCPEEEHAKAFVHLFLSLRRQSFGHCTHPAKAPATERDTAGGPVGRWRDRRGAASHGAVEDRWLPLHLGHLPLTKLYPLVELNHPNK